MDWAVYISYFWGGAFFVNAIPHFVCGTMGHSFQSPFAKPRGEGHSSSTVNLIWGAFNFVVAYFLVCKVGNFDLRSAADVLSFAAGGFLIGLFCARHFGKFNGGNAV